MGAEAVDECCGAEFPGEEVGSPYPPVTEREIIRRKNEDACRLHAAILLFFSDSHKFIIRFFSVLSGPML